MSNHKEQSIFQNKEEIAEEFGVFQTMAERDFFTFHLLDKARKQKEKEAEKQSKKGKKS